MVILGQGHRAAENVSHPTHTFPAAIEQGNALPSCFSFHAGNKFWGVVGLFLCGCDIFSDIFFAFLCFLWES